MQSYLIRLHSNDIPHELDEAPKGKIEAAFHVLCVVNTLQRILDVKQPLLMWSIRPLRALTSCCSLAKGESQFVYRKTVCAGGSTCMS
ncbi:hypothetical protein BT93_B1429 [Corymbia citriodora subsp. variegata]|nr:hypothetical protein BT93_B1429 [Corymbia citriodora subsp. variegata]